MHRRRYFGRKRPISIGSNSKRTDINATNMKIPSPASSYMRTPAPTPLIVSEQNHSPSRQSTRRQRSGGSLGVPGPYSNPSRYRSVLGMSIDQLSDGAFSPSTPSTSSIRTARSYADSSLTPTSSAVTGYSPVLDQHHPRAAQNVSFSPGPSLVPPPTPTSSNQLLNHGVFFSPGHMDISAQSMLRPPDMCHVVVVGSGITLKAENDMSVPNCFVFSNHVNRYGFPRYSCPPGGRLAYMTTKGYIHNPVNCVILKLEYKDIIVETSFAIVNGDGPPGGPEIYLGWDFWTKFYSISSSLPEISGADDHSGTNPHLQNAATLPWTSGNSEIWPPPGLCDLSTLI
ncbi:hypothetical protein F4810DRAFT_242427 [Camillea tinctor]|nr:hypothetical protein F4810DRAFT_242427 [Camillea tinctor]